MAKTLDNIGTEWAKHLRPRGKRAFWRKVRRKARIALRKEKP